MELSRSARLLGTLVGFALLWVASPGVATENGLWPLAVLGVAFWARYASRPGRWAAGIEWLTGALGWIGLCSWAAYVWEGTLAYIGPAFGLWVIVQGWALRRFARRLPLAAAAPLAWMMIETLRGQLEPPFGIQWMRLGTYLHDQSWINGSARVWGIGGLSMVLASLGGALADLWEWKRPLGGSKSAPGVPWPSLALTLVLMAGAIWLGRLVPAPVTVDGPRLMLVQPGYEQKRKQESTGSRDMMLEQIEMTRQGCADAAKAGEAPPDVVVWAETMVRLWILDTQVDAAVERGAKLAEWRQTDLTASEIEAWRKHEHDWIDGMLFGAPPFEGHGALPAGTQFLAGAEFMTATSDALRFKNSALLWTGPGRERRGPFSKRHLVPGAETMLGLERFGWVRERIFELAKYIPDFVGPAGEEPVLSIQTRDGRTYRCGLSVCFDNAFDDVFTRPAREHDVDFHVVLSNEAWFEHSQEAHQMVAFSRLEALSTGRSVVRATQSGVSTVIRPDGSEVARLRGADGDDRMVRGVLRVVVPVPADGAWSPFEVVDDPAHPRLATPFVRFELLWLALWSAAPLLLLLMWFKDSAPARAK